MDLVGGEIMEVRFVRMDVSSSKIITENLAFFYAQGWRVVAQSASADEYEFTLERVTPLPSAVIGFGVGRNG